MGHKTSEKTLDRLVGSDTREDQFCWTFCLAELAKVAMDLIPDVVAMAWPILATRIRGVQPEESSTKSAYPFCFVLFCFVCFELFCIVLYCIVLYCIVLFCLL